MTAKQQKEPEEGEPLSTSAAPNDTVALAEQGQEAATSPTGGWTWLQVLGAASAAVCAMKVAGAVARRRNSASVSPWVRHLDEQAKRDKVEYERLRAINPVLAEEFRQRAQAATVASIHSIAGMNARITKDLTKFS